MSDRHNATPSFSRCYRCTAGCIHLICGAATLVFTPKEFLDLAETIGAMRHQLREEVRSLRDSEDLTTSSFTM